MTATERARLETALGLTEPLPWPASLDEEIALAESRLADPIRDRAPATRSAGKASRLLRILDGLENTNRRCSR
jgi:hypothetical protein